MTSRLPLTAHQRRHRALAVAAVAVTALLGGAAAVAALTAASSLAQPSGGGAGTVGDGAPVAGVSVFDDDRAVTGLTRELRDALEAAADDAAREGIEFVVNSGWRSPAEQDQLFREAVEEYGSEEEAARWVASAETSEHVSGHAVDIGSFDAAAWLDENGAAYGLCRIYDNEPWHFELRPEAVDAGCPVMYFDPSEDPRMQG